MFSICPVQGPLSELPHPLVEWSGGGSKRFVVFSEAGHESYLKVDALLWKEEVSRFFSEVAPLK